MKQYVIIGASIAGVSCIEGIRSVDPEGEITLVTAEASSNYGRPLISYYLEGKTDEARMSWRGSDFYEKNRVTVLHETRAVSVDAQGHAVSLDSGATLAYDALCICTGSAPVCPKFEGLETVPHRQFFTTLGDAKALEQTVTEQTRVLIIGAGFIGLKCAEGVHGRAASVTVCDLADHAMSASLDGESASILERHLEQNGIRLLLGNTVERFDGSTAHMKNGETVEFDVLVIAVGVKPETALAADAGCDVERGVCVDETLRTSVPDIWAAGDCTQCRDITSGAPGVLAVLPMGALQGECAGVNMAGGSKSFDAGMKLNSIGFFGLHIMSAGTYTNLVYSEGAEMNCKKLFAKDGVLTGFILVGDVKRAGIYTALIRERTKLSSVDFEAISRDPTLLPLGRAYRTQKLGGAV